MHDDQRRREEFIEDAFVEIVAWLGTAAFLGGIGYGVYWMIWG